MTTEQLVQALQVGCQYFASEPRFNNADKTICAAVQTFPYNANLQHVILKAVLINSLYRTSIFAPLKLAGHIFTRNIDSKLAIGDLTVVDDIRSGHGIGTDGKDRNLYSFATKYVHFHRPDCYPLFDNSVKALLPDLNRALKFRDRFTQKQLLEYPTYRAVIDELMKHLGSDKWGYKKFDEGLWVLARCRGKGGFDPKQMPDEVCEQLRDALGEGLRTRQ